MLGRTLIKLSILNEVIQQLIHSSRRIPRSASKFLRRRRKATPQGRLQNPGFGRGRLQERTPPRQRQVTQGGCHQRLRRHPRTVLRSDQSPETSR